MSSESRSSSCIGVKSLQIRASDFLSTGEDGFYAVVEGEAIVRARKEDLILSTEEFYFVRRGTYIIGSDTRDSHLLWIPITPAQTQDFIRRHGALLSEIKRCDVDCGAAVAFPRTRLLSDCIANFRRLMDIEHPPLLKLFRVEELLMLLLLSPQGPALMSIFRKTVIATLSVCSCSWNGTT